MPATVTPLPETDAHSGAPAPRAGSRRSFRDNPRLILAGIAVLVGVLIAIIVVANQPSRLSPDFTSEFVLFALTAADLTMLVALVFVLSRDIVKLVVERRRGRPFARFRAKLVALLLGMTLVPAVLVLAVGSEVIRTSVDGWFNAPMDEILSSANQIAGDYYHERQLFVSDQAARIARALADDMTNPDVERLREVISPDVTSQRVQMVEIYRAVPDVNGRPRLESLLEIAAPTLPLGYSKAAAERLADQVLGGSAETRSSEALGADGDLLHAAALIRSRGDGDGAVVGVVVATDVVTGDLAARSRRMTQAFESYNQLRVLKRPLTGVYLSFFLMVTLMILVGSIWMGLYLAKRITQPVQALAAAAREIGAGRLDQHLEPQSDDEFGALTEAFNAMAGELATSRRKVERATLNLERKHHEVEARRRYIETILERITAGVISIDESGTVTTMNGAAARLLNLDRAVVGQPAATVLSRADLRVLGALLIGPSRSVSEPVTEDVVIDRQGHEAHLAVVATALVGESGLPEGRILVLDDVTPLIRAQKVAAWREVARRLAHEIKNPLTPIQLSAERLRRHFADASSGARALVEECTSTIVGEVESLKGLVDEFSQFARMPTPRTVPTDLHDLIQGTLALYEGLFSDVTLDRVFSPEVSMVRLDPDQIRRVVINLIDNAIEAVGSHGRIVIETQRDEAHHLARVIVADDGPGIPAAERDKLFLPYYSTKRRGSGLGLAIVRRIIAEHGGSIDVGDNVPHGTRFTIELPN